MKKCNCEWCNRTEENWKYFFRLDNEWYCGKHHHQLKDKGRLIPDETEVLKVALNDMCRGWASENELNARIYNVWYGMLSRCYSKSSLKRKPFYEKCYVCERWLKLSNFVEDISKIEGYELWFNNPNKGIALDKDIKSNNQNNCYCLEKCKFVTNEENAKQSAKYKNLSVVQYDLSNNLIKTYNSTREAERKTGIDHSSINYCCKFWEINCNKEEWSKKHKRKPSKTAGGYIWKYKEMSDNNE